MYNLISTGQTSDIAIFALYLYFVIEMCIILMNLTIGLSISNIQDLRKNADGLRLVKEVLLQRYLESLLRLVSTLPLCGLLWKNCVLANLGQLVLADIYNCNAIYTLQNIDRMYDNTLEPKLTLIQKARFVAFLFFALLLQY